MSKAENITQTVVEFTYEFEGVMLAHVGVFRDTFSNGKPNTGLTIAAQKAKAKWAMKQFTLGTNDAHQDSAEHVYDSGFHVMLMNTDPDSWTSETIATGLDLQEALDLRVNIIRELRAEGFVTTTPRRNKNNRCDSGIGNRGWGSAIKGSLLAKSTTLEKLNKVCETLTNGMRFESLDDYKAIRKVVYEKVVGRYGKGEIKKSEIWCMFSAVALSNEFEADDEKQAA